MSSADVYSRRLSCIIGAFVMGAGWLIEGALASLWPIMVAQALLGSGWTFFSGAAEAWIAGEVGEDRGARAIVRGQQADLVASIVGGFVGASLATVAAEPARARRRRVARRARRVPARSRCPSAGS